MQLADITQQTLEALKGQLSTLRKDINLSTGLVSYDLSGPAKTLYPVLTPLRNKIARTPPSTAGDTATRWKAVTGINTGNLGGGIGEGQRGGAIAMTVLNFLAAYATLGFELPVTREAELAAMGNLREDADARATKSCLEATMLYEEATIGWGNASLALGTTPAPVAALAAGGSLTAQAGNLLFCCALTREGYINSGVASGLPGQITRTNEDATTSSYGGGNAKISAASNAVTTSSGNQTINGTVAAVPGAVAYAWFVGTSAATAALAAITTTNTVTIAANPAGTQLANAAAVTTDYSQNALVFDGMMAQACKSGSGAYFKSLDGATLTSDGATGIVQIDAALQAFWDANRIWPSEILVASQEAQNINKKVLGGGGAPLFRFMMDGNGNGKALDNFSAVGGSMVGNYLNKFAGGGGKLTPISIHPNQVPGTVMFVTHELPYPLSNVTNVLQMKIQEEYHQIVWPQRTRQREFGVYVREVLQCFAPFSLGIISNVGNG